MYFINIRKRQVSQIIENNSKIKEPNPKFNTKTWKRNTAIINYKIRFNNAVKHRVVEGLTCKIQNYFTVRFKYS